MVAAGTVLLALAAAACSSQPSAEVVTPQTNPPAPAQVSTPTKPTAPSTALAPVTWLCRPGMAHNPCDGNLDATVVTPSGAKRTAPAPPSPRPAIDCFYVYPTVSGQLTANANLDVDPQETAVAITQAARFSQVCNVYAPVYRQITLAVLSGAIPPTGADAALAYSDVLNAWKTYLADENHGRGVAVIGHSQGAFILIQLLQQQVDDNPAIRAHLVSAIILGGNVTAPTGKTVGGSFHHIPTCSNVDAPGCVIAYSTYDQTPPSNSLFGRTEASSGLHVVCVNPAVTHSDAAASVAVGAAASSAPSAPSSTTTSTASKTASSTSTSAPPPATGPVPTGPTPLIPFFPSAVSVSGSSSSPSSSGASPHTTSWVTYPGLYSARCETDGRANWLQVDHRLRPGDTRPVVTETLGPAWGLHLYDVNLALGNLVDDLRHQANAYLRSR